MKNYHILLLGICLFLSSCVTVTYFGDTLPATTSVEIYYSAHDVKKDYKVIGHLNCPGGNQETVKGLLMNKAKTIGADAIVITGSTVDASGKYTSDIVNADALKYN